MVKNGFLESNADTQPQLVDNQELQCHHGILQLLPAMSLLKNSSQHRTSNLILQTLTLFTNSNFFL